MSLDSHGNRARTLKRVEHAAIRAGVFMHQDRFAAGFPVLPGVSRGTATHRGDPGSRSYAYNTFITENFHDVPRPRDSLCFASQAPGDAPDAPGSPGPSAGPGSIRGVCGVASRGCQGRVLENSCKTAGVDRPT